MDKNTIYGLLLMAAIFFGFMWLQPKNENLTHRKTRQTMLRRRNQHLPEQTRFQRRNANGSSATLPKTAP